MLNKTKYITLIFLANIFLCSADGECEFIKIFTGKKRNNNIENKTGVERNNNIENKTGIELSRIGNVTENTNRGNSDKEEIQDTVVKHEKKISLKELLDEGVKQKCSNTEEDKTKKKEYNLKLIELIKEFVMSTKLPEILKRVMNVESLIETYKDDETFQNLSCVEQMKLVLMFWCLQSQINFDFAKETIEDFTQKITYSNIKKILNDKIEELINEEKSNINKEVGSGKGIYEENCKSLESYRDFKIENDEKIKPLFYYFIKGCILTSTAILIHKYCSLCKDKFGDVFILENKEEFKDYTYKQKSNTFNIFNKSDDGDTIANTENLFSSNHKYTRICKITFEDLTTLIRIITKLPNFSDFAKNNNNQVVNKLNSNAFKEYRELLLLLKKKKNEQKENKKDFKDVHFYDVEKFFNIKILINNNPNNQKLTKDPEDLELFVVETFGDLVEKANLDIDSFSKYVKNITFQFNSSRHQVINLLFKNCKFTNSDIDITSITNEQKKIDMIKNNNTVNDDSSDNDLSD